MSCSPAIGIRSCFMRNDSARSTTSPPSAMTRTGTMASKEASSIRKVPNVPKMPTVPLRCRRLSRSRSIYSAGRGNVAIGPWSSRRWLRVERTGGGGHRLMLLHPLHDTPDRRLHRFQEHVRLHAHVDCRGGQWTHDRPLPRRQVRHVRVVIVGDLAVVHPLEHPEHVHG